MSRLRVIYHFNNVLGESVFHYLVRKKENIVGVVVHPERYLSRETECRLQSMSIPVFDGSMLEDPGTVQAIKDLKPGIGLSVCFGYIFKQPYINFFPKGIVNLHTSFLPYNRGANPNVWSIIDPYPAGVTLHYVDKGIDTGDIISQQEILVHPSDTGKTLYEKLSQAAFQLFVETWPLIIDGSAS